MARDSCDTPLIAAHDALEDLAVVAAKPDHHLVLVVEAPIHRRTIHLITQVVTEVVVRAPKALLHGLHAPRNSLTFVGFESRTPLRLNQKAT